MNSTEMLSELEDEDAEKPIFDDHQRNGKFSDKEALQLIRPSTYGQGF